MPVGGSAYGAEEFSGLKAIPVRTVPELPQLLVVFVTALNMPQGRHGRAHVANRAGQDVLEQFDQLFASRLWQSCRTGSQVESGRDKKNGQNMTYSADDERWVSLCTLESLEVLQEDLFQTQLRPVAGQLLQLQAMA